MAISPEKERALLALYGAIDEIVVYAFLIFCLVCLVYYRWQDWLAKRGKP